MNHLSGLITRATASSGIGNSSQVKHFLGGECGLFKQWIDG